MATRSIGRFEAYRVTNLVNGKTYIGITTVGLARRWRQHLSRAKPESRSYIHRAIAKYGANSFRIEPVGIVETWADLCRLERCLIGAEGSLAPCGYNMTSGGEGLFGPSMEVREAMSARMRSYYESSEAREAYRVRIQTYMSTPEARAAAAERGRAQFASVEARAAQAQRMIAQLATPAAREANVRLMRAALSCPNVRALMSEKARAYWSSADVRAAQAARTREFQSTPEARAANAARARAQMMAMTPEARAERSAAMRAGKARAQAKDPRRIKCSSFPFVLSHDVTD